MGKQPVPLHGGQWKTMLLHVVEHLGKNAEIIGGGAEAQDSANTPNAHKEEKATCQNTDERGINGGRPFLDGLGCRGKIPPVETVDHGAGLNFKFIYA